MKKTNLSISPTNIAINYSAHRVITVQYSILKFGRKLKYRRICSSVKIYYRGFCNQFEKFVFGRLHKIFKSGQWKTKSSIVRSWLCLTLTYFRLKYQKITLIFKILHFDNGTSNFNKFWNIV